MDEKGQIECDKPKGWGTRYTYSVMCFLAWTLCYSVRVDMSVAIVAMVNTTGEDGNSSQTGTECVGPGEELPEPSSDGEFLWDSVQQGFVLGGFSYGYVCTQLLGGILAERYGGKWVIGLGTFLSTAAGLLSPTAARLDIGVLIAVRVFQGLCQGLTLPAFYSMIQKWLPELERNKIMPMIIAGQQFGLILSYPISSIMAEKFGWESVFYTFGSAGCIWFIFWIVLVFDGPSVHPRISQEEKDYILNNVAASTKRPSRRFPPMKQLLMSPPFLVIVLVHFGNNWANYTLMSGTAIFLANIHHFDLAANGFLSTLPYIGQFLMAFPVSAASAYLLERDIVSKVTARKIFNSMSYFGAASGLVWLAFVGCNSGQAIAAMVVTATLTAGKVSGYVVNIGDLSPNYAGTLMGISNTIANIPGFLAPLVNGVIIGEKHELADWTLIFLIGAVIDVFSNVLYLIFAKAEPQPFDKVDSYAEVELEGEPEERKQKN